MVDSPSIDQVLADRAILAKVIRRRPRVGPVSAVLISLIFTLLAAPIVTLDIWLIGASPAEFAPGDSAPRTLRVPAFSGYRNKRIELGGGSVVVSFGEHIDGNTAALAGAVTRDMPSGGSALAAYAGLLFLASFLFCTQLRRSHRGQLLRIQITALGVLWVVLLATKIALLITPISIFALSGATVAVLMALTVDVSSGLSTALLSSVLFGLAVPFDFGVFAVLGAQAAVPVLLLGDRRHRFRRVAWAGLVGGVSAAVLYATLFYLATQGWPFSELGAPLRSSLVATFVASLASAILAALVKPGYQFLLGEISQNKLVELEDLSHPLLTRIAENSPGTWQHSLAMANMAEIAANTIGGNGRLVRVGAYFHDLGKSLQPKYFIENLEAGEQSPHDRLPPEVSCDAIFAHVTEGIRVARKHRLPERVIDFMHMHHGDGLLEYFWAKCQESGNPKKLTAADFRYPGVPPQSRETAILAICDAVEAASRTLKKPDDQAVSNLVQRIVYGKLHLGQLDESGLSMADLRKISNSLRETIKHAHHGRIEYPWQREENKQAADSATPSGAPVRPYDDGQSATQRIIAEPRLDSLDAPRPYWRDFQRQRALATAPPQPSDPAESSRRELEVAATAQMSYDEPGVTPAPELDHHEGSAEATERRDAPAFLPSGASGPSSTSSTALPTFTATATATVAASSAVLPASSSSAALPASSSQPASSSASSQPASSSAPSSASSQPASSSAPTQPASSAPDALPVAAAAPAPASPGEPGGEAFDHQATNQLDRDFDSEEPTNHPGPLSPTTTQRGALPPPPPRPSATRKQPRDHAADGDSEGDGRLSPGTLVIGPPPATRPDSKAPVRSNRGNRGLDEPTFPGAPVPPVTIPPNKQRSQTGASSGTSNAAQGPSSPRSPGKNRK